MEPISRSESHISRIESHESSGHSQDAGGHSPLTTTAFFSPDFQNQNHQRFVIADPVAFRYLEEDRLTTVLDRKRDLQGYQSYVIEQWACSRTHPTFIIAAFTGNAAHTIKVGVLSVPADEQVWSPRLRVYFKTLGQYYARRKETPLGTLMVTNLSGFPSSLTIVPVPSGDVYKHREDFFVSENLKRLGCSGRVGLSLGKPSSATQAKYYQLYKVSEKIPLYSSVIELVKLCQAALLLFGCLEPEYVDGLLCDFTERGINEWWGTIGGDLYNVEPSDGILGPTTVAALLGTLMGARNRLNAYGAPIAKDVFELEPTKRAISYFQKAQRIPKTRRLDTRTMERLHKSTAKQASKDGWNVPRAVKSTVAELSGKGGEMVMDMVGRSEKTTIADIETVDIERFAALVKGERAKWLWHGKARKRTTRDLFSGTLGEGELVSREDEQAEDAPKRGTTTGSTPPRTTIQRSHTTETSSEADPLRTTRMQRAKGRLKGAVGKRGHNHTTSKDSLYEDRNKGEDSDGSASSDEPTSPSANYRRDEFQASGPHTRDRISNEQSREPGATFADKLTHAPQLIGKSVKLSTPIDEGNGISEAVDNDKHDKAADETPANFMPRRTKTSLKEAFMPEVVLHIPYAKEEKPGEPIGLALQRTQSFSRLEPSHISEPTIYKWPRQLSFSTAEDPTLARGNLISPTLDNDQQLSPKKTLSQVQLRMTEARRLREQIADMGNETGYLVSQKIAAVEHLNTLAKEDIDQLNALHYPRRDEYNVLLEGSQEIVAEEKSRLQEAVKDLETLGAKLEYEISTLKGKVEDVEGAVAEYEKQVEYTEARVSELIRTSNREGWVAWGLRVMMRGEKKKEIVE